MAHTSAGRGKGLRGALSNRQMGMIALGGVIGAGLFVGSGSAIAQAGPAVLIAYGAVGVVVICVMQMLAEMSVAEPNTGSFSAYAHRHLGPWAGLSVGWLYAYQWCVTIGFEAVAGSAIVHALLPPIPTWLAALVLMFALIGVNFARVESFGTFEYWFAMIKVGAIFAFLFIGLAAIIGIFPGSAAPGLDNLTHQGGFVPNGWGSVLAAALVVFFSFFGTEVVTIAAGEAKDPARSIRRGMRTVLWRILLFYVGSMIVVVTLMPWDSTEITESPYVAVLHSLHIPFGGLVMNLIVLTAVFSCLNSGIYTSSRMLFSLAERGEAPQVLARTAKNGVPLAAVVTASSIGLFTIVANYFFPTTSVFQFLLASSGAVAVLVYLCIIVTHFRFRRTLSRERRNSLTVKMWLFPYLDVAVLAATLAVIVGMAFTDSSRNELILTLCVAAVIIAAGVVRQRRLSKAKNKDKANAEEVV
ncbi:amino acid permease [Spelaeicoccus albus]|uniref:Gamma-aminobutyrate permease n=1 Tax=Spelaeicoccus albus TaxID=1280376 RepID=A0A7Z0IIV9_9MICO|nr:gamma-aminobutyrate permease [Spelaeicoccus albus]